MYRIFVHLLLIASAIFICSASSIASSPDIVIFLTDQQNFRAMSCTGTPGLHTPTMDGLAKEGVRFTHAICATPQCSPARAALWTGLYPHRTGVMGNVFGQGEIPAGQSPPLDSNIAGMGKIFSSAGYETVYFGKWHLGSDPGQHGFEVHSTRKARGRPLTRLAISYLKKRGRREGKLRSLLMIVSYINPHDIYYIVRSGDKAPEVSVRREIRLPLNISDDLLSKPLPQRNFRDRDQGIALMHYTEQDWRRYLSFYYQLTEGVDREMGLVLQTLRRHSSDSLVAFLSDHGDLAGAHGLGFKGPMMYEELVRVPFIISWPGSIKPAVRKELVSQVDLLPTLCDLAGVQVPKDIDGKSLRPLLFGASMSQPVWRDAIFSEYYGKQNWRAPIRVVRTGSYKYIRYLKYGEELYDLKKDPHELTNLTDSPEHRHIKKELSARLERWMIETRDPFSQLTVRDKMGRNQQRSGINKSK
ncbi:MAG: sulfatase-like hydrolase/transferase [Planctomycetota bacterium]|nr:MAG: sulfatase-like hydrolase/transferase [Planctomycetota bacterium]